MELLPFSIKSKSKAQTFHRVLSNIENHLGISTYSKEGLVGYAERLYSATGGRIALLIKILNAVFDYVDVSDQNRLKLAHFEQAYRKRIRNCPPKENPFNDKWDGKYRDPLLNRFAAANDTGLMKAASRILGAKGVAR